MFTGIVEEIGQMVSVRSGPRGGDLDRPGSNGHLGCPVGRQHRC